MDEKLKYLDSLSPEDMLRFKAFQTSRLASAPASIEPMLPPLMPDDRKSLTAVAISAAAKAFAVQLMETAKEVQLQSIESTDSSDQKEEGRTPISESHIVEAYRRLRVTGVVPSSME